MVHMLQSELENLSFMYTNAEDYAKVKRRVTDFYKEHEKELVEVCRLLSKLNRGSLSKLNRGASTVLSITWQLSRQFCLVGFYL